MPEEHITIRLDGFDPLVGEAAPDDLIHGWDTSAGKTVKIRVDQLPFSSNSGEGGPDYVGSPFKVTILSDSYSFVGGNTIIQDTRLLGKTDAVVYNTQLGAEFRNEDLIFDPDNGILTIPGFQLQDEEHLSISVDGIPTLQAASLLVQYEERLAKCEMMLAPFLPGVSTPGKGSVWFKGTVAEIPVGWEEDIEMRGLLPLHYDPADPDFETIGDVIGSKTHTNTEEEMFPHVHDLDERPTGGDWRTSGGSGTPLRPDGDETRFTEEAGGWIDPDGDPDVKVAKPYSIMNPAKIGCWIRFIG